MPDVPPDAPTDTAVQIEWDRDHTGAGQDPDAITVVIGRWEWKSMAKRNEAEWSIDGYEVHVIQGRDEPGVALESNNGTIEMVRLHLTDEQMRRLREHGVVVFEDSRTFPFDVTVIRGDEA